MLIVVDCLNLSGVDNYALTEGERFGNVYAHAVESVRELFGRNRIVGLVSPGTANVFDGLFEEQLVLTEAGAMKRWQRAALALKDLWPGHGDDVLVLAPSLGVVTLEGLHQILEAAGSETIAISCSKRLPDMHPAWQTRYRATGDIFPGVVEVEDLEPVKLQLDGVSEICRRFLPGWGEINGSHDMPQLVNEDASIVHVPWALMNQESFNDPAKVRHVLIDAKPTLLMHRLKVFNIDFENPDWAGGAHG